MGRLLIAGLIAASVAVCSTGPSQAEREFSAYDRVLSERVAKHQISPAEADLARQQYIGALRNRESAIAANNGAADAGNAYASNSTMALGMALMCAGQRGGHC